MKKIKTRKELLLNSEFKILLFEFFQEMGLLNDEGVENKVNDFVDRKLEQCKMQGV